MTASSSSPPSTGQIWQATPTAGRASGRWSAPARLAALLAALFAAVAVVAGGAGLTAGKVASVGVEHAQDGGFTFHGQDRRDGFGPFHGDPNR